MLTATPRIRIEGICGSGKTILAYIIAEALEKKGIKSHVFDGCGGGPLENAAEKVNIFRGKTLIIETINLKRLS